MTNKPWWTSKTILSGVAMLLVGLLGVSGITVDAGTLTEVLVSLATAVAGGITIYGRATASKAITLRKAQPMPAAVKSDTGVPVQSVLDQDTTKPPAERSGFEDLDRIS